MKAIPTEVLIIGAGAAGLRAAIELAEAGVDVLVVSKRGDADAHTTQAAGGINAVLGTRDPDDDWTLHAADTLREGHFIGQPEAVELLARRSPERVRELARWGCPFERTDDDQLEQRFFGAHTFRRTCFVGDRTGQAVLGTLIDRAQELDLPILSRIFIAEVLTDVRGARGAVGWRMTTGEPLHFTAKAVVIAAGGCTGIYRYHSSRDDENTGDAMGLAWGAGAALRDMEFVQFHPTGMATPASMAGHLVTEAVRAEGGRLVNALGERFMSEYAPRSMELAPRDVVARAIAAELRAGRGTEDGGVLLDISHRDRSYLRRRLPAMVERFDELGIDISEEPMEVAPTAHYAMGGIKVDFATGATTVNGLFAIGEATAGLHGANRLGGNSLAETLVFGQITGAHLVSWCRHHRRHRPNPEFASTRLDAWAGLAHQHGEHQPRKLRDDLREICERHAGMIRSEEGLRQGLDELTTIERKARDVRVFTTPGSPTFARVCGLQFMLITAEAILRSALHRRESRGAHFRYDHPDVDPTWGDSLVCMPDDTGVLTLHREPLGTASLPVQRALARHLEANYHHLE